MVEVEEVAVEVQVDEVMEVVHPTIMARSVQRSVR